MVLADTGEDAVVRCAACGYGGEPREGGDRARGPRPGRTRREAPLVEVPTPGKGGIDDVVDVPRHHRRRA